MRWVNASTTEASRLSNPPRNKARCGGSFASAVHAPVENKPVTDRGVQSAAGAADASNAYTASRQEASYISMACVLPLGELVAIAVA